MYSKAKRLLYTKYFIELLIQLLSSMLHSFVVTNLDRHRNFLEKKTQIKTPSKSIILFTPLHTLKQRSTGELLPRVVRVRADGRSVRHRVGLQRLHRGHRGGGLYGEPGGGGVLNNLACHSYL